MWRDNLDGKRDKPDEAFGARDLLKMYGVCVCCKDYFWLLDAARHKYDFEIDAARQSGWLRFVAEGRKKSAHFNKADLDYATIYIRDCLSRRVTELARVPEVMQRLRRVLHSPLVLDVG